ncbi:hypothetical protein ABW19_dt0208631 [Dactylella cylindrospora]|nr:hypothetical protein ABW19_dt0208631 [Dactylella cylindrospora]
MYWTYENCRRRNQSSRINRASFGKWEQPHRPNVNSGTRPSYLQSATRNPNFGLVDLGEIDNFFAEFPSKRHPGRLFFHLMNPKAIDHISRSGRVEVHRYLSPKREKVHIFVDGRRLTERDGDFIDLAAVLIISIALRGPEYSRLVGELIGVSTPSTLKLLRKYTHPKLLPPAAILTMAHAAARHFTQRRQINGGRFVSYSIFRLIPQIIASTIVVENAEDFELQYRAQCLSLDLQALATRWEDPIDTGIQVGMTLIGIRISLRAASDKTTKEKDRIVLFLKVLCSGLGAANIPGNPFQMALPILEDLLSRWKKKGEKKFESLWVEVLDEFQNTLELRLADIRGPEWFGEFKLQLQKVFDENNNLRF